MASDAPSWLQAGNDAPAPSPAAAPAPGAVQLDGVEPAAAAGNSNDEKDLPSIILYMRLANMGVAVGLITVSVSVFRFCIFFLPTPPVVNTEYYFLQWAKRKKMYSASSQHPLVTHINRNSRRHRLSVLQIFIFKTYRCKPMQIILMASIPPLSSFVLAIYAVCGGLLICCLETQLKFLRVMIAVNFGFLFNSLWRFLFYMVLGSVAWTYDRLGGQVMAAALAAVAIFNTYVLCRYPSYRRIREQIAAEEDKRIEARISKEVKRQAVSQLTK